VKEHEMNDYQVVYDITQQQYAWWFLFVFIAFLAISIYIWRRRGAIPGPSWWQSFARPFLAIVLFLVGGSLICALVVTLSSYMSTQQAYNNGNYKVVAGAVENLKYEHNTESFTVSDITFAYTNASLGPGFHQTSEQGGPIDKNGLQVRVTYAFVGSNEPTILKLEIRR
jgi:glucan phosphoethanolaminetransferase (alkaline phosphatase superfamily)